MSSKDRVTAYLEHLDARVRLSGGKANRRDRDEDLAVVPFDLADLCATDPHECLKIITSALQQADTPGLIRAIGDELLENFDPAIIAGWVTVFQDLGTTKAAERKSLWKNGVPRR